MPASDLVYDGARIDELEVIQLIRDGKDISSLNPFESRLWSDKKRSVENYNDLNYPLKTKLKFKNIKASPREIFRAVVIDPKNIKNQYVITASLDNHTNIIRASLLRLLGYDLDVPRYNHETIIEFSNESEKNNFIELLGEQTLTKRDKWIKKEITKTKVIFKGLTIEPAELRNVNIHLPIMARERQQDRRVFRALLGVYSLTDFPQKINSIAWSVGREFNNQLILNHPYATEFRNTTRDDLRWILRKISALSAEEIKKVVSLAKYPKDIEDLICEKLFSRINSLNNYLKITKKFKVNKEITNIDVLAGKLIGGNFEDYVVEFYEEDPENPYRFSEIFRLFKTQIMYSSLSGILDTAIQKIVPGYYSEGAIEDIQEQMSNYRRENPSQDGSLPLKAFASPVANGRVFTNRNIVFGQYLGSSAPIQLVDSVGAEATLGIYTNLTGLTNTLIPSMQVSANIGRSYIHVRAMPDLKTASKQSLKKLFVPGLMKKLGKVIKDEYECSISKKPYHEETTLGGKPLHYVKYDPSFEDAKKDALKLRADLIESGIEEGRILLVVINRETLCTTEISQTRKDSMLKFTKEFALNETFIINDTIRLQGNINAPIPIPNLPGATISLGTEHNLGLLRSITLRKTENGFKIITSQQRNLKNGLKEGLNYYVEVISNSNQWIKGKMISKVYNIDLVDLDDEKLDIALRSLRELFVSNDQELMKENYKSKDLDHDIRARLNTFRLLWFKKEKMKMNHEVQIVIPNKDNQNYSEEERTRTLYSTFIIKRKGNDFHSFLDRAINSLTGFISIGSNNGDPGQTFMGNGKKESFITESELTKGQDFSPMTKIEYSWTGWQKKTKKLEKYFREIENMYKEVADGQVIDRTQFYNTSKLKSYDIRSTIILYPTAFNKVVKYIFDSKEVIAINQLYNMYGHDNWNDYCQRAIDFFGDNGPQVYYGERTYNCIPDSVKDILDLRKKLSNERKKRSQQINELYRTLFQSFEKAKILKWLGKENFFASNRITGFREGHHKGYIEYISDTLGEYNSKYGTGLFDKLGGHLGISPYELRAMIYTPGM